MRTTPYFVRCSERLRIGPVRNTNGEFGAFGSRCSHSGSGQFKMHIRLLPFHDAVPLLGESPAKPFPSPPEHAGKAGLAGWRLYGNLRTPPPQIPAPWILVASLGTSRSPSFDLLFSRPVVLLFALFLLHTVCFLAAENCPYRWRHTCLQAWW